MQQNQWTHEGVLSAPASSVCAVTGVVVAMLSLLRDMNPEFSHQLSDLITSVQLCHDEYHDVILKDGDDLGQ